MKMNPNMEELYKKTKQKKMQKTILNPNKFELYQTRNKKML